jgi:glycosyltransferase involved in cell wall biosynthesis
MRIGIDARTILNPEKSDAIGSGHYTYQLVRHILDLDRTNEYVLFFDHTIREKDVRKFRRDNVKIVFYPFSDYQKYIPGVYSEVLRLATLQKERLDVLHSTSVSSRIPVGYVGKTVVTFSSLCFFGKVSSNHGLRKEILKARYRYMSQKANRIIAISESVKRDLKKFLEVPDDKIKVIYNGVDRRFFEEPEIKKTRVLGKYGIRGKYFVSIGTIEPSKNILRLIRAFADFKNDQLSQGKKKNNKKVKFNYQLVIAGKKGVWDDRYVQIAKELDVFDNIVFTGYVIGNELSVLIKNADLFVASSLCGNCGVGVLEALASKTPSVISRIPLFKEIAKDASLFVDPMDVSGISGAMSKLCCDHEKRKELSEKGLLRAKDFEWRDAARQTIELYESMV